MRETGMVNVECSMVNGELKREPFNIRRSRAGGGMPSVAIDQPAPQETCLHGEDADPERLA